MSGGEGEPVEADAPAEDETVAPQGTHVTGTQTVTHGEHQSLKMVHIGDIAINSTLYTAMFSRPGYLKMNGFEHLPMHGVLSRWSPAFRSLDFKLQLIGGPLLTEFNRMYENQFMASLLRILERPGAYIGCPSLDRLLDIITGYTVAVYDMTGYHISFERKFRQYLCFKYNKDETEHSLQELLLDGKDDRSGFESFAQEFKAYKILFEKKEA